MLVFIHFKIKWTFWYLEDWLINWVFSSEKLEFRLFLKLSHFSLIFNHETVIDLLFQSFSFKYQIMRVDQRVFLELFQLRFFHWLVATSIYTLLLSFNWIIAEEISSILRAHEFRTQFSLHVFFNVLILLNLDLGWDLLWSFLFVCNSSIIVFLS
jgi:hypothetical protein